MDMAELLSVIQEYVNNQFAMDDSYVVENYGGCILDFHPLEVQISENNKNWNIVCNLTISDSRLLVKAAKKAIKKLINWYMAGIFILQNAFNRSVTLSLNEIVNKFYHLQGIVNLYAQKLQEQKKEFVRLQKRVENLEAAAYNMEWGDSALTSALQKLQMEVDALKWENVKLRELVQNLLDNKRRG